MKNKKPTSTVIALDFFDAEEIVKLHKRVVANANNFNLDDNDAESNLADEEMLFSICESAIQGERKIGDHAEVVRLAKAMLNIAS